VTFKTDGPIRGGTMFTIYTLQKGKTSNYSAVVAPTAGLVKHGTLFSSPTIPGLVAHKDKNLYMAVYDASLKNTDFAFRLGSNTGGATDSVPPKAKGGYFEYPSGKFVGEAEAG
jgi:hypothetical protein